MAPSSFAHPVNSRAVATTKWEETTTAARASCSNAADKKIVREGGLSSKTSAATVPVITASTGGDATYNARPPRDSKTKSGQVRTGLLSRSSSSRGSNDNQRRCLAEKERKKQEERSRAASWGNEETRRANGTHHRLYGRRGGRGERGVERRTSINVSYKTAFPSKDSAQRDGKKQRRNKRTKSGARLHKQNKRPQEWV